MARYSTKKKAPAVLEASCLIISRPNSKANVAVSSKASTPQITISMVYLPELNRWLVQLFENHKVAIEVMST